MSGIKTMTTYRMADDSLVYGEYSFVLNEEYFTEGREPVEVIREVWQLVSEEAVTFNVTEDDEDEDQ